MTDLLHISVYENQEEVIRVLLEHNADPIATNKSGRTPLHLAAWRGEATIVLLLLSSVADIDVMPVESGPFLLQMAIKYNHVELVELLLASNTDIIKADIDGATALHYAAYRGFEEMAQLLLEKMTKSKIGIDVKNNLGQTALHIAARHGRDGFMRQLLFLGANVAAKDNVGLTALHFSSTAKLETTAQLLLENGADIEAKTTAGKTALHCAAMWGNKAVAQLLLECYADVDAVDDTLGFTPLFFAASCGHTAVIQLLLDHGANISATNKSGGTALKRAVWMGRVAAVKLLLENGASTAPTPANGRTPLHTLAEANTKGWKGEPLRAKVILLLLLKYETDAKAASSSGETAEHLAVKNANRVLVRLFWELCG
jgi:ankyrin